MKKGKIIVRNWSHNTKAMLLHRQILKMEKNFHEELQRRKVFDPLGKNINLYIQKEKPDQKTLDVLAVMMGKDVDLVRHEQALRVVEELRGFQDAFERMEDSGRMPLILTASGNLRWASNKDRCCKMREGRLRLKIIQALIGYKDFRPSREIMEEIGSANYDSFTNAVASINERTRVTLQLFEGEDTNFILSKSSSGYRINPLYPVRRED